MVSKKPTVKKEVCPWEVVPLDIESAVKAFVVLQSTAGDAGTGVGNGVGDGVGDDSLACIAEQLLAHCRERLAPYKVPARMVFLPALPKAGMGKTDKKALRALL